MIKVKVKGRTYELNNSNQPLGSFPVSQGNPEVTAFSLLDTVPEAVPTPAMADRVS